MHFYNYGKATMFHQPTLPNLEEAIAAIAQEEVRLKVMKNNVTTPSRPAFIVTWNNETRDCFNCGETGHLSHGCHAPRRPTCGSGRGYDRGGPRGGSGQGYWIGHKANVVMQAEESDDNVEVSVKKLQELRKLKTKTESTTGDKYQRHPTFGDFARFAYANEAHH